MKCPLIAAASACSTELVLPPSSLERTAPTGRLANGKGDLAIRWIDVHRRLEGCKIPVQLLGENTIGFTLDLRRTVAMRNELRYAENIAAETRERHKKDRASQEPLKRRPSLSDPVSLARILERPVDTVKFYAGYRRETVAWQSGALLTPERRAGCVIPIAVNNQLSGRTAAFKVC